MQSGLAPLSHFPLRGHIPDLVIPLNCSSPPEGLSQRPTLYPQPPTPPAHSDPSSERGAHVPALHPSLHPSRGRCAPGTEAAQPPLGPATAQPGGRPEARPAGLGPRRGSPGLPGTPAQPPRPRGGRAPAFTYRVFQASHPRWPWEPRDTEALEAGPLGHVTPGQRGSKGPGPAWAPLCTP